MINDVNDRSEQIQSLLSEMDDEDIPVHTSTNVRTIRPDDAETNTGKCESKRTPKNLRQHLDEDGSDSGRDDPHVQVMRRESAVEIVVQYDHEEVHLEESETGVTISADDYSKIVEIEGEIAATERTSIDILPRLKTQVISSNLYNHTGIGSRKGHVFSRD